MTKPGSLSWGCGIGLILGAMIGPYFAEVPHGTLSVLMSILGIAVLMISCTQYIVHAIQQISFCDCEDDDGGGEELPTPQAAEFHLGPKDSPERERVSVH